MAEFCAKILVGIVVISVALLVFAGFLFMLQFKWFVISLVSIVVLCFIGFFAYGIGEDILS